MNIEITEKEMTTLKEALTVYIEDRKKAAWNGWPIARLEMERAKSMLEKYAGSIQER